MLVFENDYSEGAHQKVLEHLIATNMEPLPGYGSDPYCDTAKEKIKAACQCPKGEVWFTVGGTQTNALVIDTLLQNYEGVIAADTGHISSHEAGAIERGGHKVLTLPHEKGKLTAQAVEAYLKAFYADQNYAHMVFPGMVYISQPTEYGTLYSKAELSALSAVCKTYDLPMYADGARLGYALACKENDVTLADMAALCDVFYIGGTKVGALCGEALVFTHGNTPKQFVGQLKQHGALLAKGRLLGVQFDALFTDNLYLQLGQNAITQADKLRNILKAKGYPLFMENPTNQIFVVLENERMEALKAQVRFSFWEALDEGHTVVRFATSWATTDESVEALAQLL